MPTTQTTPVAAETPAAYDGFDRMLLNGRWTHGRSGQSFEDVDPYTNDVLLRIPLADQADLDDAFAAAAAAQPACSSASSRRAPRERGRSSAGRRKVSVLPPHIFVNATNDMSVAAEELFGPVVGVIKVHGEDDALRVANETSYGLSAAVFTRDVERGNRFAQRVQAGMTHVNDSPVNDLPNCPFGGEKNSGLGRYNGRWSIEEFTTVHWISVQHEPAPYPF